jgi:hypothetical protein
MTSSTPPQRVALGEFAGRFQAEMIPLGNRFCYFCAAVSLSADDLREYLEEPIAALPPLLAARLPNVRILLVPYLEKGGAAGEKKRPIREAIVALDKPQDARSLLAGSATSGSDVVLAFAINDTEVADYHYRFYRALAELVESRIEPDVYQGYCALLSEELAGPVHGEVDEASWRAKQALLRRGAARRDSKAFKEYAWASFVDTLTLFLHGICCDIDVETGPRQLPSRFLRRRLQHLRAAYPPPTGYAVLPEDAAS